MNRYAFSYLVKQQQGNTLHQRHGTGFLRANSYDEANGKALRIVHKLYPHEAGWYGHLADCLSDTAADVEPETAILLGEERSS